MAIERLHDDYMAFVEQIDGGGEAGFVVNNDNRAEWAVKKIRQAHKRIAEAEYFVQGEVDKLNDWLERVKEEQQRTIDYMTWLLRPYFEHLRESGALGKKKSYTLPSGVLQVRTAQVSYARDEEQLLPYARQIGLVKVKETPDWAEIKKRFRPAGDRPGDPVVDVETGEIVPGVTVQEPEHEVFSVKVETEVSE